jgi:hypothetical protein
MKPKWLPTVGFLLLSLSSAQAMTGAELINKSEAYAQGYIWGVVESLTFIASDDANEQKLGTDRLVCLMQAKVSDVVMAKAVRQRIVSEPKYLTTYAIMAVISVVNDMCPAR